MRPHWLTVLGLTVCLLFSGCMSVGRLGYETLPTLATWRVDRHVSLDREQKARVSQGFDELLAWHRTTQLEGYGTWLRGIRQTLSTGQLTEADIRRWREEAWQRFLPIVDKASPDIAALALTLEPAQMAHLRAEFDRDNAKRRRDWMPEDPNERIEVRGKRYIERAEFFLGSLSGAQKQLARRKAAEAPPAEDQWYEQRLGRQKDFMALLERIRTQRPSQELAARWVREHFARWVQLRDGPERSVAESSLAAGDAMTVALFAQATPRQRRHLIEKLDDWIELTEVLRQGAASRSALVPSRSAANEEPLERLVALLME